MDRFVVREPRAGADYPQGNQMIAFSANTVGCNSSMPYATEFSNMQPNLGYMGYPYLNSPQRFAPPSNLVQGQGQMMSGIDTRYLAGYSDNSAQFIVAGLGQPMHGQSLTNTLVNYGENYQNQNFVGPERNNIRTFLPKVVSAEGCEAAKVQQLNVYDNKNLKGDGIQEKQVKKPNASAPYQKPNTKDSTQNTSKTKAKSRLDKLDVLCKKGLLAFSGTVDKVLKWHKSLQNMGAMVLYEIVAKCVSVSSGESSAKNLVVRDQSGPAMQVVYYEIDFLLPDLKPPCTVRIVGRMVPGTCRLQAFSVRPATGDDVAMLSRRAAVSEHHITKLCNEYRAN